NVATIATVFSGTSLGGLTYETCANYGNNGLAGSNLVASLTGGTPYYVQVGLRSTGSLDGNVTLDFATASVANDAFASATAIGSLPARDSIKILAATVETDESRTASSC